MTAACYCVGHYRECHTQKKYVLRKPVMLVRIQNPLQQEPASCKQSTSVSKLKWQLLEPYQMCAGLQRGTGPAAPFFLCNSSRFRTHRTKCNNSSFRFRFRYENSSDTQPTLTLATGRYSMEWSLIQTIPAVDNTLDQRRNAVWFKLCLTVLRVINSCRPMYVYACM